MRESTKMIFVTVGTHEQAFNRLIEYVDAIKTEEEIFAQTGYSSYIPQNIRWKKFLTYQEMQDAFRNARVVITHGGPSTFMESIGAGKIPIVVPRQKCFDEHVNDHQLIFVRQIEKQTAILPVYDIADLKATIDHYDALCAKLQISSGMNNLLFARKLDEIVNSLICKRK